MSTASTALHARSTRLTSLDQFRGYTMFGMILVNFLGGFKNVCPYILQHHNDYCSYADTIMPQFLFAAGFAMRLSLGRRLEAGGKMPWGRAIRRVLGLALVAIAWYSFNGLWGILDKFQKEPTGLVLYELFKRHLCQTLLHIALTSMWILPVIIASWRVRVAYAVFSGILHIVVSWSFNYAWVHTAPNAIDGGPLGFLTWAIPALLGTLACDAVRASGVASAPSIAVWGFIVMLIGWTMSMPTTLYDVHPSQAATVTEASPSKSADAAETAPSETAAPETASQETPPPEMAVSPLGSKFACDPVMPTRERIRSWDGKIVEAPFVPPPPPEQRLYNYWMMSQRSGGVSYPTFAAGFSLVVYALFLWLCDGMNLRLGLFRTLGTNSLAAYMLADVAGWTMRSMIKNKFIFTEYPFPRSTEQVWVALAGFAYTLLFVYAICWIMERLGWYVRV